MSRRETRADDAGVPAGGRKGRPTALEWAGASPAPTAPRPLGQAPTVRHQERQDKGGPYGRSTLAGRPLRAEARLSQQGGEAGVVSHIIVCGIHLEKGHVEGTVLARLVPPLEKLISVAEVAKNHRDVGWRNVLMRRKGFHLLDCRERLIAPAGQRLSASKDHESQRGTGAQEARRRFAFGNSLPGHSLPHISQGQEVVDRT